MRKASLKEVLLYGMGGMGSNIPFMLTMQFLMFFYTDIVGISAAAVGGLFLVSRFIDAITDPIMGMIADSTKSKFGKYRPYVQFGGIALGFTVIALFWSPNVSLSMKILYVYITYIVYSLVSTVANIPYHSLTPIMSEDPDQRTTIATTKQIIGVLGTSFVTIGAVPITTALGGDARAWLIYATISAVVIALAFQLCALGAKRHDTMELHNAYSNNKPNLKIKEQLAIVYKNKAVLMLMIAFGTDMIAMAAASAVNVYYFIYAVNRPDLIALIASFGLFIGFPVTLTVPLLSKLIGKKRLFTIASSLLVIVSGSLFFIPYTAVNLIVAQAIVLASLAPFTGVVGWAMLADCVEYGEYVTGNRGAGIVSSQLTFINKLGMALGGFLAGALLAAFGYVANQAQTEETLRAIVGIKALLPAAGYLASVIAMQFYPITKEFYGKMIQELSERRRASA